MNNEYLHLHKHVFLLSDIRLSKKGRTVNIKGKRIEKRVANKKYFPS